MSVELTRALMGIPDGLRVPLLAEYAEIIKQYQARRWESVGLKAGKLCEIIYTILKGRASGIYDPTPSKPSNMLSACNAMEQTPSAAASRSVRIQMPRVIAATYELRNNRAIGHVSGDLSPSIMDAEFFVRAVKWMVAELIREYCSIDVTEAGQIAEIVTDRIIPVVWQVGDTKRVLNASLTVGEKVLVLLYVDNRSISSRNLVNSLDYSNGSRFRNQILKELHDRNLLFCNRENGFVTISPLGQKEVEDRGWLGI